ncbi:MAG TPA: hypothetical protein VN397_00190 [Candidatus Methylomirabilis sp.]|nr:hypothetical protein [Candidatus Methylomirabilis sp.]
MEDSHARSAVAERWRSLTREQKLSVGVLGVCGLIAILFSFVRIRNAIIRPFTTPVSLLVELRKKFGPTEQEIVEQQKRTDTDGDGISDFEELNVYKSSPYLRDSDSDGDPDNLEVAKGTDPNCPKGKTCVGTTGGTEAPGPAKVSLPKPEQPSAAGAIPALSIPPREPQAVRAWLQTLGFSAEELANHTDTQILEAYDEAVSAQNAEATSTSSEAPAAPPSVP